MAKATPWKRSRCVAHSRSGERCKRSAIVGGTVCTQHGGKAPQVQAKAAERIKALEEPAIDRLGELLGATSVVPMGGELYEIADNAARHRAAALVLRLNGHGESGEATDGEIKIIIGQSWNAI